MPDNLIKPSLEEYYAAAGRHVNEYGSLEIEAVLTTAPKKTNSELRTFTIKITPSIDSKIGPHLDADFFMRQGTEQDIAIGHGTLISGNSESQREERVRFVQDLINAGGAIRYSFGDDDYDLILNKFMTSTDSKGLIASLLA